MKDNDFILLEVSLFFSKNTQSRRKVIKKKKKKESYLQLMSLKRTMTPKTLSGGLSQTSDDVDFGKQGERIRRYEGST